jgi:phosphoribosylanthranilate isomerase
MATTRIKICGITRPEDAEAAVVGGADAIGMVFYPESPRAVSVEQAREITAVVPPFVTVVGLFVDEPATGVQRTLSDVPIDLLQFHGEESPGYCRQFGRPWIKALRIRPGVDIRGECDRYSSGKGVLMDTWHEGKAGGTGTTFDWELARAESPVPVVLAGGLDADNVGEAIRTLRPAAVDVSSGVESSPGVKDASRIQRFIEAVREADQALRDEGYDE